MFGTRVKGVKASGLFLPVTPHPCPQLLLQHSLWSLCLCSSLLGPSSQVSSEDFLKHSTHSPKLKAVTLCQTVLPFARSLCLSC